MVIPMNNPNCTPKYGSNLPKKKRPTISSRGTSRFWMGRLKLHSLVFVSSKLCLDGSTCSHFNVVYFHLSWFLDLRSYLARYICISYFSSSALQICSAMVMLLYVCKAREESTRIPFFLMFKDCSKALAAFSWGASL